MLQVITTSLESSEKIENPIKETEVMKKNQVKIIELNNIITEIKTC